jgi:glycosyltransferase involved in cell wall biosynthesis
VAIAGPFAGSVSAIGRYDESVVDALDRRRAADPTVPRVDPFVDGSGTSEPTPSGRARPVRAIGRYVKPWDHDHLVAVLGSSPSHVATAELALAQRCHVWLHDASLVGVHLGLAHQSGSRQWADAHVTERLARDENEAALALVGADLLDAPRFDELGIRLLGEALDRARSVIVSSPQAAAIVRDLRPDGAPILVLPLAHPPLVPPPGPPAGRDVVAVGWLADNKSPELALDVLARLDTDVTLSFVGPTVGETADRIRALAEERGLAGRVTITGRLDDDAYRTRLHASRVGLQLRRSERGEMSAATLDLLAHGIPTVTTMVTAGPPSPGLQIIGADATDLAAAVTSLLDDEPWQAASADALDRAGRWTFDDVASALLAWLDDAEGSARGSVQHASTVIAGSAPLASPPLP